MKNKKGQRRVALLVLILTLVLCLSTLLQGLSVFADAEVPSTDSENQTTQTQENTAQAQEESDSEQVQNEQNEAEAEGNSGEESEAQAVNTDVPQTAALTLSWANVSNSLYKNVEKTKKVTFTATFDATKDTKTDYAGYTIQKFVVYDVTADKAVTAETNQGAKVDLAVASGHEYRIQAEATKQTDGSKVTLRSAEKYSVTFPGKVSSVSASCASKDNLIKVTWGKVDGADKYCVYRSTSTTRPSSPLKVVTTNSYSERMKGGSYYYWVQAVNSKDATASSSYTRSGKVTAGNYLTCKVRNYWFTVTTKKKVPIYKSASSKKVVGYLKKGTTVKVIKKSPKVVSQYGKVKRIYFNQNGKKGWIKYSSTKLHSHVAGASNDWSKSVKEDYVNSKKFTSKTNYLIWVSKYTQKVYVFKRANKNSKWVLKKTYRCSTGTFVHPTPTNLNYIVIRKQAIRHRVTRGGLRYYYKYLSAFGKKGSSGKGNAFHTICWNERTNKPQKKVNDRPNTKGCARMFTSQAYWIYKNVPNKTRVVSY